MQRLKMKIYNLTFGECCELYIQDCKARNLRAATISHYRSSYKQIYKYFSPDMPIIDFDNLILNVRVTKTRKPLLIPLNVSMINILKSFLVHRQFIDIDDWLFCNVYGKKLTKSTSYHMLYEHNHRQGVTTTGLHRYRHTFAKQWILNGGSVVTLSKLLGHSNLNTTQNYINLLVSDISKQVEQIDLLNQFADKKYIKMRGKTQ